MTMVASGPYSVPGEQKYFDKNAMAGPNIKSYQANYDKFQAKATPIGVSDYKVTESSKWQNSYGKMQTNSHPDFKPIYGPQQNKRPTNEIMDLYKKKKEKDEKEKEEKQKELAKQKEMKVKNDKDKKDKTELTPKKQNESPNKRGDTYEDYKDSPKRVNTPKKDNLARERNEKSVKAEKVKQQPRAQYQEPRQRKPFDKNAVLAPNVKSYSYDYDKRFPMKASNMDVPEYKPGEGNRWQKSHTKMQSSSHPDFYPIYGPQKNKRTMDIMDMYKAKTEKEKKEQPVKQKKEKMTKENKPEMEKDNKIHQDKTHGDEIEKKEADKSPKKVEKEIVVRRKEESPRQEYHKEQKDTPRHEESKVRKEYPRPEAEDNDEKYYGYEDRPERKIDKKVPVRKEPDQSKLKEQAFEVKKDNSKEVKPTPREEKKEVNKDKKYEDNRRHDKVTPKDKSDPYDQWKREEREKVNTMDKKIDPYTYRRNDEPEKVDKHKEIKPTREDKSVHKEKPIQMENAKKETNVKKEEPRKDTKEVRKDMAKNEVQGSRDREKKVTREEDGGLYTNRDHARPTKTQNNYTSIVRDGNIQKAEKKNKPTAKVLPTARDTRDEKKWSTDSKDVVGREEKSVRARYYGKADMDDVLQDKIATQLRENGIAETKVVPLSAKITQAVRDDVIDANTTMSPQVTSNLTEVINKHLDPILFNRTNATDLRDSQKPSDARHLSNLVLLRMGQVHEEIELCKLSVDDPRNKKGKGHTPRDEPQDRSQLMAIKDGIEKQKTERDIYKDKLNQAQRDTQEVEDVIQRRQGQLQNLDADNWQLKQELNDAEHNKQNLVSKLKEQQKDLDNLDKQHHEARHENLKLKSRLNETEGQNQNLSGELTKLQSENAKLKVLTNQKEKEILHLRDPDKDMVHQIRILSDEVTMLRTQSRRLNEEKALLKSRSQKMESSLDESNRQKGKYSVERDNLLKENQELKQRYRKLALSNPQQRTLPDIMTGRNGPSAHGTPRTNSRAPSRSIHNSDDRKMSAAQEEDEDDVYGR